MPQQAAVERDASNDSGGRVAFEVETDIPTRHGLFRFRAYRDLVTASEHLAIVCIEVVERVPIVTGTGPANGAYLRAKRDRMGHLIPADT
jgi:GTP cyclohydrolase II